MGEIATQRELSQLLDVSPMAVSRALRGKDGVSDELRERIVTAARRHGLIDRQPPAKPPGSGLKNVVALMSWLCVEELAHDRLGPFPYALLQGVRRAMAAHGGEVVICGDQEREWPLLVRRGEVDGVILPSPFLRSALDYRECPVPAIACFTGEAVSDRVLSDDFRIGELLGGHLAGLGHRQVAFLGPNDALGRRRAAGLRTAIEDAGGRLTVCDLRSRGNSGDVGATMARDLWAAAGGTVAGLRARATAIVGYNDQVAASLMTVLDKLGVAVPADVSVAGVDGVPPLGYPDFGLTTVSLPLVELGEAAVDLLHWRLRHAAAPPRTLMLAATLRPGQTTGPPTVS